MHSRAVYLFCDHFLKERFLSIHFIEVKIAVIGSLSVTVASNGLCSKCGSKNGLCYNGSAIVAPHAGSVVLHSNMGNGVRQMHVNP